MSEHDYENQADTETAMTKRIVELEAELGTLRDKHQGLHAETAYREQAYEVGYADIKQRAEKAEAQRDAAQAACWAFVKSVRKYDNPMDKGEFAPKMWEAYHLAKKVIPNA